MKRAWYCYSCENEFTITTKTSAEIEFCPFCGSPLETADCDELEEEQY